MTPLVFVVVFFAMLIQTLVGFGSGLIAMPFLIALLGLDVASPAFALTAQFAGIMFIWRYRAEWHWQGVWRVMLASLVFVPLGMWGAHQLPQHLILMGLGIVLVGYALYSLSGFKVPHLIPQWGFLFGALGGLLHGAYNTGGPPLVVFATSQNWSPMRFKCNVQSMFFINGVMVIATHAVSGRYTPTVFANVAFMIPAMLLGMLVGTRMDMYLKPQYFRSAVLVLLLVLGLSLVLK